MYRGTFRTENRGTIALVASEPNCWLDLLMNSALPMAWLGLRSIAFAPLLNFNSYAHFRTPGASSGYGYLDPASEPISAILAFFLQAESCHQKEIAFQNEDCQGDCTRVQLDIIS